MKGEEKAADGGAQPRGAGSADDFSPEAQAAAGTYYASPVQTNRGTAATGARAPTSPALVNVNAASAPAPAPAAASGMNYYKADAKGTPAAATSVRQRGQHGTAPAQTKKRFNTQPASAAGGGQTLIIDDED